MTIRLKVLLLVGVAMGLVLMMGMALYQGVRNGRAQRDRFTLIHAQIDGHARLRLEAGRYLHALLRARDHGEDTRALAREMEAFVDREGERLKQAAAQERALDISSAPRTTEEELEAMIRELREWIVRVEQAVRGLPDDTRLAAAEWRLLKASEREVGELIQRSLDQELEEKERQFADSEAQIRRVGRLALIIPAVSCVLLVSLLLIILIPMGNSLRALLAGVQRMGRGSSDVELPTQRKDELGVLSRAFNQMAWELKETLLEKQHLMKAEAEATAREVRRYNALLEQTVRERTEALAQANTRLTESLEQLKTTQAQLIFSDRLASMGRLAAGVGHEINNPLSYVLSNLNYVHRTLLEFQERLPAEDREELLEVVKEAREGAERVRLIVQDLRTLSRQDDTAMDPVDLGAVVRGTAKLVSRELRYRARLVEEVEEVPPVLGSMARLGQVFLNLIINAAHAIAPGREDENEIRVVVRQSTPERVLVEVRDTGCGIPEENLSRIFEPFFTTRPVGEGTGLGLSVCHGIITSMGGEMTVESKVGHGTVFRIALPVARRPEAGGEDGETAAS